MSADKRRPPVWPLTQSQLGLWFLDAVNPGSAFYVTTVGVRLRGDLDVAALRAALADTVERQPALRTRFVSLNGRPYQVFAGAQPGTQPMELPLTDLSHLPEPDAEQRVTQRCDQLAAMPFSLTKDRLLRAELMRVRAGCHVLLLAVHHIIFDGGSAQVLLSDLAQAYTARSHGDEPRFAPLTTNVGQYALEQERRYAAGSARTAQAVEHWSRVLAEARPLDLPADFVRPAERRFTGATLTHDLDEAATAEVRRLAAALGVTPFHVLATAFTLTMARACDRRDVVVGVPTTGRTSPELGALVGFFINTLPLRVDLAGVSSFADAVARHWTPMMELLSYQDFPFARLVDELQPARVGNRNPYFDVCFQFLPWPASGVRFGDTEIEVFGGARSSSQFDLSCDVYDLGNILRIVFEYSDELFLAATVATYQDMMVTTLRSGIGDPHGHLNQNSKPFYPERTGFHPPVTPADHLPTAADAWVDGGMPGLVTRGAAAYPQAQAVRFGPAALSYAELDAASARVAAHLGGIGIRPGDPVALLVEPSNDTAIGMLGVMRSGATYVPLDLSTPALRVAGMLDQVGCDVIVVHAATAERAGGLGRRLVRIGDAQPGEPPGPAGLEPGSPAYMIFTSGSTGRPKAVLVPHGAGLHLARAASRAYELTASDQVLQMASASVDVSIEEFFGTWHAGGCVVIHPAPPADLGLLAEQEKLTVLNLPASRWQAWTQHLVTTQGTVPRGVRLVIAGSERVDPSAVRAWRDGPGRRTRLLNAYGTTEATVTSVWYDTASYPEDAAHTANVPIGFPFPGVRLYVLDESGRPVTGGTPGELCIGGPGVALGYVGDPALTQARFVPDPFDGRPGSRMYRTGDRVRELPSGALDFLGRTDTQVKLRGFRIDLTEIERTAAEVPGVAAFVADIRDSELRTPRLVGYLRPAGDARDAQETVTRVRDHLQRHLPAAMIPSQTVIVDDIPLTIAGKVDRSKLPDPAPMAGSSDHLEPRSETERTLRDVWAQILGTDTIGIRDNFFEIGGDSIIWLQVMSRCLREGLRFQVRDIFDHQTIERLAEVVTARGEAVPSRPEEAPPTAGLTPIQSWFFETFKTGRHRQNQAQWYGLPTRCAPDVIAAALADVVEHHEALRTTFHVEGDAIRQDRGGVPSQSPLTVIDVSAADPQTRRQVMREESDRAQDSLDIHRGPMLRVCLFLTPAQQPDLLFWCIHHLVVDAVSWQFLEEDLETAVAARRAGRPPTLPPRTASPLEWARWSAEEADRIPGAELDYWRRVSSATGYRLPVQHPDGSPLAGSAHEQTRTLAVPQALKLAGDEVLAACLVALARVLAASTGDERGNVWLEYHGRPFSADGPDVTRTVGWFTALFPFSLDTELDVATTRERLAAIPHGGIGYGRARYLRGEPIQPGANVLVNYVPPSAGAESGSLVRPMPELEDHGGPVTAADAVIPFAVELNLSLDREGSFQIAGNFSARHFSAESAAEFAGQLRENLAAAFSDQEAARFLDAYPVTPMQRMMLYRHLMDPARDVNYNDQVLALTGPVDVDAMQTAWRALTRRHDALRTSFRWHGLDDPVQVVHREGPGPLRVLDWRSRDEEQAQADLAALLAAERSEPPALSGAPPFRLTLIRRGGDRAWLVWIDHHILLDGWSSAILVDELIQLYADAHDRRPLRALPPATRYRDYVQWLLGHGTQAASRYWRSALGTFDRATPIPLTAPVPAGPAAPGDFAEAEAWLDPSATAGLREAARQARTTLGVFFYAAWAAFLHRFSSKGSVSKGNVVFGIAHNGRPPVLGDVGSMVGLYMQTVPLAVPVDGGQALPELAGAIAEECWRLNEVVGTGSLWDIYDWTGIPVSRPLFDSVIVVQNFARAASEAEGLPVRAEISGARTATGFPLTLFADPDQGVVLLVWRSGCLDESAARQVLDGYVSILRRFAAGGATLVGELALPISGTVTVPGTERRGRISNPPRGETETRVAAVWREVLEVEAVSRDIALFDAGGTSLSARLVHARLCEEFGVALPVTDVFEYPTVAAMAARLDGGSRSQAAEPDGSGARAERMDRRRRALRSGPRPARRPGSPPQQAGAA